MQQFNKLLIAAVISFVVSGCSSNPKVAECNFPNTREVAPGWVCDEPVAGMVTAVGSAHKSDAGFGFMKQMAATEARVQLAQMIRVQVQNMIKRYAETTGSASKETVDRVNTSVTKQITDETLQGTKILKSTTAPDGAVYVLVGIDEEEATILKTTSIKTSMKNDEAAWQRFQAGKAQDELADAITHQKK